MTAHLAIIRSSRLETIYRILATNTGRGPRKKTIPLFVKLGRLARLKPNFIKINIDTINKDRKGPLPPNVIRHIIKTTGQMIDSLINRDKKIMKPARKLPCK